MQFDLSQILHAPKENPYAYHCVMVQGARYIDAQSTAARAHFKSKHFKKNST